METEYEYTIQSVCSPAPGDISTWTEVAKFTTLSITCYAPTEVTATATHQSAIITWQGEADNYQVSYRQGEGEWTMLQVENARTTEIIDLTPVTAYSLRIRSICTVGDTSVWCKPISFKTAPIPECVIPTDLKATSITDVSALLEWEADESNLSWDLRYRAGSETTWNTTTGLEEKQYQINSLQANTPYLWSVKATCDEGRTSAWAGQENFTTQPSGINNIGMDALKVYASGKIINISNAGHALIERVQLFGVNGQVLREYRINSDENVLIPTDLEESKVIIKVCGKDWTNTYTVFLK